MTAESDGPLAALMEHTIGPNMERIIQIAVEGGIAGVVHDLDEGNPQYADLARSLGWDGKAAVFALVEDERTAFANGLRTYGDEVAANWLSRPSDGELRMFVMIQKGTLLLNCGEEKGWYLEPGSTDGEREA